MMHDITEVKLPKYSSHHSQGGPWPQILTTQAERANRGIDPAESKGLMAETTNPKPQEIATPPTRGRRKDQFAETTPCCITTGMRGTGKPPRVRTSTIMRLVSK